MRLCIHVYTHLNTVLCGYTHAHIITQTHLGAYERLTSMHFDLNEISVLSFVYKYVYRCVYVFDGNALHLQLNWHILHNIFQQNLMHLFICICICLLAYLQTLSNENMHVSK